MSLFACPLPIPPPQAGDGTLWREWENTPNVWRKQQLRLAADLDGDDVGPLLHARAGGGGDAGDDAFAHERGGERLRDGRELVGAARGDEDGDAGIGRERHAGG